MLSFCDLSRRMRSIGKKKNNIQHLQVINIFVHRSQYSKERRSGQISVFLDEVEASTTTTMSFDRKRALEWTESNTINNADRLHSLCLFGSETLLSTT